MDKKAILESLDLISEKIEIKFNTTILRKLIAPRSGSMFRTIYPIDNNNLTGRENNIFGPNFPKLKSFDDKDFNIICTILVPIFNKYSEDFVIDNELNVTEISFNNVIKFCTNDLSVKAYNGGKIKMSYEMPQEIDTETFYSTKDSLISAEIYPKFGSVTYGRIIFYI